MRLVPTNHGTTTGSLAAALLVLGTVAFLLVACSTQQPTPRFGADPGVYELRDTTEYENTLSGGRFAILRRNGEVFDTVDLDYGFHRLRSGAVTFLPVRSFPDEDFPRSMDILEHVIFDGSTRVNLNSFLPDFSDYFSSPSVISGLLFYWGLEELSDGEYRVHAVRYDPHADTVTSRFLEEMEVRTDFRAHFAPPAAVGEGIRFETYGRSFLLDADQWELAGPG